MSGRNKWTIGRCLVCGKKVWATSSNELDQDYAWWCENERCKNHDPIHTGDQDWPDWVNNVAENKHQESLDVHHDPSVLFEVRTEQGGEEVSIKTSESGISSNWLKGEKRKIPMGLVTGDERFRIVIPECCGTCESRAVNTHYAVGSELPLKEEVYCAEHGYFFPRTWDEMFHVCGDYKTGLGVSGYCEEHYLGISAIQQAERSFEVSQPGGPDDGGWFSNAIYFRGTEQNVSIETTQRDGHLYSGALIEWVPDGMQVVNAPVFGVHKDGTVCWEDATHGDDILIGAVESWPMSSREGVEATHVGMDDYEERVREYLLMARDEVGLKYIFGIVEHRLGSRIEVSARGIDKVEGVE